MNSSQHLPDRLEALLLHYFQSHDPDPAFLAQLREGLLTPTPEPQRRGLALSRNRTPTNWRYALAVVLLLIFGAIAAIGPSRVLAQIEHWLGYAPGLGMVELSGSRALGQPVSRSEGDISFRVEQFVASPSDTLVSIRITGLPIDVSPSSLSISVQWDGTNGRRNGLRMRKAQVIPTFPACSSVGCPTDLQPDGYDLFLAYEPLPPDVDQVQILWQTRGMVPDASPTDTWTLDLYLTQVSNQNAHGLIQPGYAPLSAEDSYHGIKVTVDRVFSDGIQTVIDASILVPAPAGLPSPQRVSLSTDKGDLSEPAYFSNDLDINGVLIQTLAPASSGTPTLTAWPTRWRFGPVDAQASRMTLSIESINITYDVQLQFDIETGQDPKVGTSIPLDVIFNVEGFPFHINQARIVMVPALIQGKTKCVTAIEFTVDSALSADGRRLRAVWFSPHYRQDFVDPSFDRQLEMTIGRLTWDPALVRNGVVTVNVDTVVIEMQGPWVTSWDVPTTEN